MTHMTLSLEHIETSVVQECAALLTDVTPDRNRCRWRLTGEQIKAVESYVGPRLTRLALRGADFMPSKDPNCDDWFSRFPKSRAEGFELVEGLAPEDFGIALRVLDVDGRLRAALGIL